MTRKWQSIQYPDTSSKALIRTKQLNLLLWRAIARKILTRSSVSTIVCTMDWTCMHNARLSRHLMPSANTQASSRIYTLNRQWKPNRTSRGLWRVALFWTHLQQRMLEPRPKPLKGSLKQAADLVWCRPWRRIKTRKKLSISTNLWTVSWWTLTQQNQATTRPQLSWRRRLAALFVNRKPQLNASASPASETPAQSHLRRG